MWFISLKKNNYKRVYIYIFKGINYIKGFFFFLGNGDRDRRGRLSLVARGLPPASAAGRGRPDTTIPPCLRARVNRQWRWSGGGRTEKEEEEENEQHRDAENSLGLWWGEPGEKKASGGRLVVGSHWHWWKSPSVWLSTPITISITPTPTPTPTPTRRSRRRSSLRRRRSRQHNRGRCANGSGRQHEVR